MTLQRITHTGAAPTTGVQTGFSSVATTFTILSGTGYPTGSGGPFVLKIDGGTVSEEKILCSGLSGTTVTVASSGRGYDGTSAASHSTGTTNVEHCYTAAEADDNSDHVYTTSRDDHTQYLRVDGTRAGTSTQTFGGKVTVSGGGIGVTGNSTVTGTLGVTGLLTVGSSAALTVLDGASQQYLQAGSTGITTNGSGQATITFAHAFPSAVDSVVTQSTVGNGGFTQTLVVSQSAASFVVEALTAGGAAMNGANVTVNWIAIGH